jgi:hypothetical protein
MVRLYFEPRHKVMLVDFSGTLTMADLVQHDELVRRFVAAQAQPVPGIADFSRVEKLGITIEHISGRAQQPQIKAGQRRIYVAPTPEKYGLCRMFASLQVARGATEPEIVRSLAEAYDLLGLEDPKFQAVDMEL